MESPFCFIVKPKKERYENTIEQDGMQMIVNTTMQDHNYVSRIGVVLSIPSEVDTDIIVGDEVVVHHNVFRRFYDMKGNEKNSASYFKEDTYFVYPDQIFAYKRDGKVLATSGFCFVKPVDDDNYMSINIESDTLGEVVYKDSSSSVYDIGDVIGFTPFSKYEFNIYGEKLYRVLTKFITLKING